MTIICSLVTNLDEIGRRDAKERARDVPQFDFMEPIVQNRLTGWGLTQNLGARASSKPVTGYIPECLQISFFSQYYTTQ